MPESRLARTRDAYVSRDPIQSLARIYLQHASGLIRDGRATEAISTIEEAVRILGIEPKAAAPDTTWPSLEKPAWLLSKQRREREAEGMSECIESKWRRDLAAAKLADDADDARDGED